MSSTIHAPCDPDYYVGTHYDDTSRGVTTWNLNNEFTVNPTLAPGDTVAVTFTCTEPKYYLLYDSDPNRCEGMNFYGQDAINVVYNAWRTNAGPPSNEDVQLKTSLNTDVNSGGHYISEVSGHGALQAHELGNVNASACDYIYDDRGQNTLFFINASNSTIQLDHVRILRTYKMCNPTAVSDGNAPICSTFPGGFEVCSGGNSIGTTGGFDATRIDTPCSSLTCGGLSATHWQDTAHEGHTLHAGSIMSWMFNFGDLPDNPHRNYVGESICLFNFNLIWPMSDSAQGTDVTLNVRLNGTTIDTYYLSGLSGKGMAPTHDLATEPSFYGTLENTIELINTSNSVDIKMVEEDGGIDIYRIYQTAPICEDVCESCEVTCEVCNTCCDVCENACNISCQTCQNCYTCQTCEQGCEIACQDCQTPCEVSCQDCQTPCNVSCQDCQTGCQVTCQDCQTACDTSCQDCQTCYPCFVCYTCMTCQTTCELTCQTACEAACQTGCEVSCQTGCEVSCQTACDTSCQDCQTCYPCFVCYSWYT